MIAGCYTEISRVIRRFPKIELPQTDDLSWEFLLKWMIYHGTPISENFHRSESSMKILIDYPLVNVYITMDRSTIFHGKTH